MYCPKPDCPDFEVTGIRAEYRELLTEIEPHESND
jgi:hypothetical protein